MCRMRGTRGRVEGGDGYAMCFEHFERTWDVKNGFGARAEDGHWSSTKFGQVG